MLRVAAVRIKNLRSLGETSWISLRPINILVGRNSAGKSTFARLFPLLKQSAERRKRAPLLWYGRLVDFGSFADAVSSFAEPPEIQIGLRLTSDRPLTLSRRPYYRPAQPEQGSGGGIEIMLTLCEGTEGRTQLRRLELNVFGVPVCVDHSAQTPILSVAGKEVSVPQGIRLVWDQGVILSQLRVLLNEDLAAARVSDAEFSAPRKRVRLGEHEVIGVISNLVHGNTQLERKIEIADRLPLTNISDLIRLCKELPGTPDTWRTNVSNSTPNDYRIIQLQRALTIYKLDLLLAELDDAVSAFCNSVSYLEPLRATAQRYYRREEVSVDELDPKGLNTAFFVQGLSARERDSLNAWLRSTFNFELRVEADRGHVALHIQVDNSTSGGRNMADVGLGYSQLTPVALQLWAAQTSRRSGNPSARTRFSASDSGRPQPPLVVVEQPELHLHPAFQGKLADVFVSCVSGTNDNLRLVAETHSPNLIGRLGELVINGKVEADDINVLLFEPDESDWRRTNVRLSEFSSGGVLQNWPIGFFDY